MKENKFYKVSPVYMVATWVLVIIAIVINFVICKDAGTKFDPNTDIVDITRADVNGVGEVDLPYTIPIAVGEVVSYSFTLPENLTDEDAFMFQTNYFTSYIEIDGKKVASFGEESPLPYGRMLGNIRLITRLSAQDSGKTVTVYLKAHYPFNYSLQIVQMGKYDALRYNVLYNSLWRLVLVTFYFTLLLLAIVIAIHNYRLGRMEQARMYMCLTGVIVSIATWIIFSSDLPQFFTGKNAPISFASFLALTLIGPMFMGYCAQAIPVGRKAYIIVGRLGFLLPIFNIVFYMLNLEDPVNLMYLTHAYLLGSIILVVVNCIRSWNSDRTTRMLLAGVITLMIAACGGLIAFYRDPIGNVAAIIIGIGLALFIFFMLGMLLNREDQLIREGATTRIYKELAYLDILTNLGNRAALEAELSEALTNGKTKLTFVLLDLNRLKITNDELGHQAGDELIKGIAYCISEAFSPEGKCFRLGGDEFAVVIWDRSCEMDEYLIDFQQIVEKYNEEHVIQVSSAIGYAEGENLKSREEINKIYSRADKNMYYDKMRCHKEMDEGKGGNV